MTHNNSDDTMPLISHLAELRNRLLHSVLVILVLFIGMYSYSSELYLLLVKPLTAILPLQEGNELIATSIVSPLLAPLKLAFILSIFAAMPFILFQLWAFIVPALYSQEKKLVIPLFISSVILFYLGIAFVYFIILPIVFSFLTSVGPSGINLKPDITNVLNFCLKMFFAFGLAFEIPIATVLLIKTGISTTQSLKKKRPYIFLSCFIIGMLMTPPDMISQTILALPMYALFEIGLLMSIFLKSSD